MTTTLRLDPHLEKRLNDLAALTGRTKSYYIRKAIEEYIDDMEDIYVAEQRLENPGKIWTLEEIVRGDDLKQ